MDYSNDNLLEQYKLLNPKMSKGDIQAINDCNTNIVSYYLENRNLDGIKLRTQLKEGLVLVINELELEESMNLAERRNTESQLEEERREDLSHLTPSEAIMVRTIERGRREF